MLKTTTTNRPRRSGQRNGSMRRATRAQLKRAHLMGAVGVLLGCVALAGCGSSSTTSTTSATAAAHDATTTQATTPASTTPASTTPPAKPKKEHLPRVEKVIVGSPAVSAKGILPARYTCDGADTPLPITWVGIPRGTKELMLDVISQVPVDGQLYIDWSVAHISPRLHGLKAGKLPAGVTTGVNSSGTTKYNLCPAKHATSQYVIVLFALPHTLATPDGYNAAELRTQALRTANYENFQIFTYTRG